MTEVAYDDLPQVVRPLARQFYSLYHVLMAELAEGEEKAALVRRLLELRADALALLAQRAPPGQG